MIKFIEQRFGVVEHNISPWRRAVTGDLTSAFDFAHPNEAHIHLPSTDDDLPPTVELAGGNVSTFRPTLSDVIVGVPAQEKGIRPARALPYELHVHATVNAPHSIVRLVFSNTGRATAVFQVRSGSVSDPVRAYTVEAGKTLAGVWDVDASYQLSVYGPNGFARYFSGRLGAKAAVLDVRSTYDSDDRGAIRLVISNAAAVHAEVNVFDAYAGHFLITQRLQAHEALEHKLSLDRFHGWYDLIVTVSGDQAFKYRLAGHVETGRDSFSDPALGGLVILKD